MAKATDTTQATEEISEPAFITPKALGEELDVNPKRIRAFLRQEWTRNPEAKNTSWMLDEDAANAVRARFTPAEDDEADEDEDTDSES